MHEVAHSLLRCSCGVGGLASGAEGSNCPRLVCEATGLHKHLRHSLKVPAKIKSVKLLNSTHHPNHKTLFLSLPPSLPSSLTRSLSLSCGSGKRLDRGKPRPSIELKPAGAKPIKYPGEFAFRNYLWQTMADFPFEQLAHVQLVKNGKQGKS